jgi:hypothetical protein
VRRWLKIGLGILALGVAAIGLVLAVALALVPPPPEEPALAGRFTSGRTEYGGRERTWLTYQPAQLAEPAPVVFCGSSRRTDSTSWPTRTAYWSSTPKPGRKAA